MPKLIRKVPDGGWGWMVVLGAAVANMGNMTLVSVFGLAYGEAIMKTSYGIEGVALVLNVHCMVTNFSGLLTGPILKRFSPRAVTSAGVLLAATGLILSSFATTIWHFILSFGVFAGFGLGLISPASFIILNAYFDKRKGQAVGMAMAGTGIGQTCMPQVVTHLLDAYAFGGTVLIMGAISLHGLIGALLFQPVERHLRTAGRGRGDPKGCESVVTVEKCCEEIALLDSQSKNDPRTRSYASGLESTQFDDGANNNSAMDSKGSRPSGGEISQLKRISSALDLHLLLDATFVHIIIGLSVVYTASIAFSMLFPFHLAEIGLARAETAWCMSALSAADILGRLTIPRLARRARMGFRTTLLCSAVLLACCRSVLAFQTSFAATLAASVLCGYVRAATVINQNLTVSEYCERDVDKGSKQLPSALGLNMVSKGIFVLTLGQFFAWARAPDGSYVSCILIQSAFLLAVALSWGGEMALRRRGGG